MSVWADWFDHLSPLTNWQRKAQAELQVAIAEGMPGGLVGQFQTQLIEANQVGGERGDTIAEDVYNEVARWRQQRGTRDASPAEPGVELPNPGQVVEDAVSHVADGIADRVVTPIAKSIPWWVWAIGAVAVIGTVTVAVSAAVVSHNVRGTAKDLVPK